MGGDRARNCRIPAVSVAEQVYLESLDRNAPDERARCIVVVPLPGLFGQIKGL